MPNDRPPGERPRRPRLRRRPRDGGIPLRTVAPNAVTALALCSGLTGIRFAIAPDPAIPANWELAVLMVLIAGVLDGIDGKIARLVRGESRFGAELDSLSDAISFGVAPALILYLWSLHAVPSIGWLVALLLAVFCALRLARFNAAIDRTEQPHKSAGFLTGVPAPAGALLAFMPLIAWLWSGYEFLRNPWFVAGWVAMVALLMVSSIATFGANSFRLRHNIRFEAIAVMVGLVAAMISAPWQTLSAIGLLYLATIPFSVRSYRRVRRQRAAADEPEYPSVPEPPAP